MCQQDHLLLLCFRPCLLRRFTQTKLFGCHLACVWQPTEPPLWLSPSCGVPAAGTWYAGINGDDAMECKFTLSINKFDCPLNCSGRGRCIHNTNGTHTCQCDEVRWSPLPRGAVCLTIRLLTCKRGGYFSCSVMGTADSAPVGTCLHDEVPPLFA